MTQENSGAFSLEDLEKLFDRMNIRDGWACETCLYFKPDQNPDGSDTSRGDCRRNSPQPKLGTIENEDHECSVSIWPQVRISDWCGEYIKRRFAE